MPKRSHPASDLLAIGIYAPLVIAARLQKLAAEGIRPTPAGRRETARMVNEKSMAAMEAAFAAQKAMLTATLRLWADVARLLSAFALGAPTLCLRPALAPVRRRVRQNARRLTGG
jgi:hypothetical protein